MRVRYSHYTAVVTFPQVHLHTHLIGHRRSVAICHRKVFAVISKRQFAAVVS